MYEKEEVFHRMILHGRVQGVAFRELTKRKAKELGLVGSVRNLPDGSLEIIASGCDEKIRKLFEWAMTGPPSAQVERYSMCSVSLSRKFDDFVVVP